MLKYILYGVGFFLAARFLDYPIKVIESKLEKKFGEKTTIIMLFVTAILIWTLVWLNPFC